MEVRDLVPALGRFCFAMGPLDFLRPFLAPIFAWTAAVNNSGKLMVPWSVGFLLKFLSDQLGGEGRLQVVQLSGADIGDAFRSDAKAEGSLIRVGGWECRGGKKAERGKVVQRGADKGIGTVGVLQGRALPDHCRPGAVRDAPEHHGLLVEVAGLGERTYPADGVHGQPREQLDPE